jgi:hypothetical protein
MRRDRAASRGAQQPGREEAAVQPDSQKLMVRWGIEPDEQAWFHLDSATDLWDGETPPTKT